MPVPHATEAPSSISSDRTIGVTSFTPAQAAAIPELVDQSTATSAEALRHGLGWWHVYLALYLLAQIALAVLALILTQAVFETARCIEIGSLNRRSLQIIDKMAKQLRNDDTVMQEPDIIQSGRNSKVSATVAHRKIHL